jgi:hypothetical protein
MLKRTALIIFALLIVRTVSGHEGMWLPQLLGMLNEQDMKSMGMQISAEDIYSVQQSSLKDAVLQFGAGCTGELVSDSGLFFTNHHCGFSQIQSLSTIEKNYLQDGFWAKSFSAEIPCPGLTVTFIRDITDVTASVLYNLSDTVDEVMRGILVKERSDSIEKTVGSKLKGVVRSFYQGNKYYLFTTEVYSDVRFVGAPPADLGKFGGETDNWVWPRHNADFSLFRIYVNKDNEPANYSKENIPYKPKKFLTINISGIKENDFVFIFGFPGSTREYLLSPGFEMIEQQTNPNRIAIRDIRLDEMRNAMRSNDTIKLQYSAKFSTLENSYKKWKGELLGFKRFDVLEKKKKSEKQFFENYLNKELKYTSIFAEYDSINKITKPLNFALDFYLDAFSGVELLNANARFNKLIDVFKDTSRSEADREAERKKVKADYRNFYKNWNKTVDRKICEKLFEYSYNKVDKYYQPDLIKKNGEKSNGKFEKYAGELFSKSLVADSTRLMSFFDSFNKRKIKRIKKDPTYLLMNDISDNQGSIIMQLGKYNQQLNAIQRKYLEILMRAKTTKAIYPDANSTLRVSYGRVEGMIPRDGMRYDFYTTADGILKKWETGEYDYTLPSRMIDLIKAKDYGRYGVNGTLNVGFLASAHTTGGNSGSPVLNAKGELVGLNFDRMWEGVLSDYYYDETYCRNICLDIRYALFIVEKYGNATRLISEMKISQ